MGSPAEQWARVRPLRLAVHDVRGSPAQGLVFTAVMDDEQLVCVRVLSMHRCPEHELAILSALRHTSVAPRLLMLLCMPWHAVLDTMLPRDRVAERRFVSGTHPIESDEMVHVLVFEHCGDRLDDWWKDPTRTDAERKVALCSVIECVRNMHAAGVVHRDLHMGNIVIDRWGRARLIDFETAGVGADRFPDVKDIHAILERTLAPYMEDNKEREEMQAWVERIRASTRSPEAIDLWVRDQYYQTVCNGQKLI